jgi:hypothetical protein
MVETRRRQARFRPFAVAPAVTPVDLFLRVQEKNHECQIVIELKKAQVRPIDARQPYPNEFVGEILNAFQTNNLFVKLLAIRSRDATKNDHQWFAGLTGDLLGLPVIAQPAFPGRRLFGQSSPPLRRHGTARQRGNRQSDQTNQHYFHETLRARITLSRLSKMEYPH